MKRHISEVKTKYAVRLGVTANSFYDPLSKCNLFRRTPYYFFDHQPTQAIVLGVQSGKLIDLKGNILEPKQQNVDVESIKQQVRAEIESEVRAEMKSEKTPKGKKTKDTEEE